MPIYEFFCPDNRKIYSFFARSLAYAGRTPRCPDNPKFRMERMISRFSFTGRAKEEPAPTADNEAEDARFGAAMEEVEREFGAMDDANPDPRQVARMLRRVTAISGEKMPEQMEEMMRRLEGGEDLEKLEEEFGEAADEMGGGEGEAPGENLKELKERLRARRPPTRDPVMYEMSEYVDP
jgi:hypothetical protein